MWWLIGIAAVLILFYKRASITVWTVSIFALLLLYSILSPSYAITMTLNWVVFAVVASVLNIRFIRRQLISQHILRLYRKVMPRISKTEQEAIDAGTVSWTRELFSGNPNWQYLHNIKAPKLSDEERAFFDGPTAKLCSMLDDWDITHKRLDMPPKVWKFLKDEGFFSFIIPKQYGGKEFSAYANSEILTRIYACSVTAGSTVAVPNSLGPAELLLNYGTTEQKDYYLPRLAKGEEVPCFALTGPVAGSDAGAIPDNGVVCKGQFNGEEVLGMRLNFNKRYITLAPIATIIGLAFKLFDPDHLLGDKVDLGITCALIPRETAGMEIGNRHFPLNIPFQNGPIHGKDVFVPLDYIIGGRKMMGQGWRMLMECLAKGRAISLPASGLSSARISAFSSGAYSRIREQFNTPIGYFEGIEEPLARIAGYGYMIDAHRSLSAALIDSGEKPAVAAAITKACATEYGRKVANDAMDIHGGKGICMGPNNYLARGYQGVPISITVEGANILTRCLMIFGQGVIRCHPYVLDALEAANNQDKKQGSKDFDKAIFGHIGLVLSNIVRAFTFGISCGYIAGAPRGAGKLRKYYRELTRYSTALSLTSDVALATMGASLKRKEKISGRLADIFSMLYIGTSILKHYQDQGSHQEDLILVDWAMQEVLYTIKKQYRGLFSNFPNKVVSTVLRCIIFPLGIHPMEPKDNLGTKLARMLMSNSATKQRLTHGVYTGSAATNPFGKLAQCLQAVLDCEDLEKHFKKLIKKNKLHGLTFEENVELAVQKDLLSKDEAKKLLDMHALRMEIINVDDFEPDELLGKKAKTAKKTATTKSDSAEVLE